LYLSASLECYDFSVTVDNIFTLPITYLTY